MIEKIKQFFAKPPRFFLFVLIPLLVFGFLLLILYNVSMETFQWIVICLALASVILIELLSTKKKD